MFNRGDRAGILILLIISKEMFQYINMLFGNYLRTNENHHMPLTLKHLFPKIKTSFYSTTVKISIDTILLPIPQAILKCCQLSQQCSLELLFFPSTIINPGTQMVFSCHVSFYLRQLLSLPVGFLIFQFFKSIAKLFCRISLNLDLTVVSS